MNYHTSIQTKRQKQLTNISFRRKNDYGTCKGNQKRRKCITDRFNDDRIFIGCSATGENSGGKLVKIAVCVSDQTPAAQALTDVFKPMVEEATDGRYDIQIYNSVYLEAKR